ncbi:MAG: class I SAM-dependent methyltransferase [Bacteroidetes bacterium]|nr:class I SAM-dependent methyltransferase [Bacteroidota bacterium]
MKSSDNLTPRRKQIWDIVRVLVPRKMRWFFEGHPKMRGQLWYAERKLLYETIRTHRPKLCFEIGTWRGGGSTLFVSQALFENGSGMVHTVEIDKGFYDEAVSNYRTHLPHLIPHVSFHLGDFREIYKPILEEMKSLDFLILDGAEDPRQTLDQYTFFLPYIKSGTVLMVHDWFTEKTTLLKPVLENAEEWEITNVLEPPVSVGLAILTKK